MLSDRALNSTDTLAFASARFGFKSFLLNTLSEEWRLLRVVGRCGITSRRLCHLKRHTSFAQGLEKLWSRAADDMIGQLACLSVDGFDTEFPENFRGRPAGRRQ